MTGFTPSEIGLKDSFGATGGLSLIKCRLFRYGNHAVSKIEYHFVWVAKSRYKVLEGEIVV